MVDQVTETFNILIDTSLPANVEKVSKQVVLFIPIKAGANSGTEIGPG